MGHARSRKSGWLRIFWPRAPTCRLLPITGLLTRDFVVLTVHAPAEQPAAERAQPLHDVVHQAQIDEFDQVAVHVSREEEGVAARRLLGRRDALDALRAQ